MRKLKDLENRFMEDAEFRTEYARAEEESLSRRRCARTKGTDTIRVEMHGKDRGIDARRPFATG